MEEETDLVEYPARADLGGFYHYQRKASRKQHSFFGELDLFIPLIQSQNSLLFFDLRLEDLESITITADTAIQEQIQKLEKHSFLLSTIATLSPFMGLLGTVWGILISFSELQHATSLRETVLGGLSTALSTTVVGLIIAIPAIIFYNTLKNSIADLQMKLQSTALNVRDLIELQYKHS